jgi:dUTPase
LVLARVERIEWELTNSLSGSKRGQHGFGSTGV